MFDCSPIADDDGALDLSTAVFPSSSQEPVPPVQTLSHQQRLTLSIFMSINGQTTGGESLTGVQISEEGLIQGTLCHSIGERKHNCSLLSGRHWIMFYN